MSLQFMDGPQGSGKSEQKKQGIRIERPQIAPPEIFGEERDALIHPVYMGMLFFSYLMALVSLFIVYQLSQNIFNI